MPSYGDTIVLITLVLYALAVLGYAIDGNWPKVLYFLGAIVLTIGILLA